MLSGLTSIGEDSMIPSLKKGGINAPHERSIEMRRKKNKLISSMNANVGP